MIAFGVVVRHEVGDRVLKRGVSEEDHSVQTLGFHRAHEAFAERFVGSIKAECLSRMIFFGASSLRHAISEYMKHYHSERNHQGIGNRLLQPAAECAGGPLVKRRARLGGVLSYYYRQAA